MWLAGRWKLIFARSFVFHGGAPCWSVHGVKMVHVVNGDVVDVLELRCRTMKHETSTVGPSPHRGGTYRLTHLSEALLPSMRGYRSRLLWISRYYTNLLAFVRRYKFSGRSFVQRLGRWGSVVAETSTRRHFATIDPHRGFHADRFVEVAEFRSRFLDASAGKVYRRKRIGLNCYRYPDISVVRGHVIARRNTLSL